jgi:hypothetical protein
MKAYLLIFTFFLVCFSYGQNMFETKLDDCKASVFFLEGKEIFAQKDLTVLMAEIIGKVDSKLLTKARGEIKIQIFVDTLGNACCVSLQNNLNKQGKKIDFAKIINNFTKWTPPISDGKLTSICTIIRLEFSDDRMTIQRQGFNRKLGGYIILESKEIRK